VPPGGSEYKVTDGESWKVLAARWGVDVRELIYFNFQTNNPDQVNWYLSHRTGCNKPTPDGFNWTFSSGAKPGKIYRPPMDFEPHVVNAGPQGLNPLARYLDGLDDDKLEDIEENPTLFRVHLAITIWDAVHVPVGILIAEGVLEGPLALVFEVAAPGVTMAFILAEIGLADMEAIDFAKRSWFIRGFSYGVVLGANGAKNSYVVSNFKLEEGAFQNSWYPDQAKAFQNAYHLGLLKGLAYGRQLNLAESGKLIKILHAKLGRWSPEALRNWDNWGHRAKLDYYGWLAAEFRGSFMAPP
jgi:hypothetical protein